jgi:hypothetical protein
MQISPSFLFGKISQKLNNTFLVCFLLFAITANAQQPLGLQLVPNIYGGGYNIKCNGGADGRISSQVVGGIAPYTYIWSNGANTPNIANVPAGNYLLTVTDANSTSVSAYITLNQPAQLSTLVIKSQYGSYNTSEGVDNGEISLKPKGGVAPLTYLWSNGETTDAIDSLFAGTYTYTIKDIYNCSTSGSVTLTQPSPLAAAAIIIQSPACSNTILGIVKANVTGGDPPYDITWNNGNKGDTAFNLLEGPIEFTVIDQSRSQVTVSSNLVQASDPMAISFTPTVYPNGRNTSCYTCTNGIIQTSITGGLAPLTYNWQPIGATTANLSNLAAGHYTLTVTDHSGCIASSDVYLTAAERDDWGMNGSNIDPNSHFIGSTNNADVIFKRNNLESLRLSNNGKVGIGISNPQFGLDVNGTARFSGTLKLDQVPEITVSQEINNAKIIVRGQANELRSVAMEDILANMTRCRLSSNGSTLINWVPTPSSGSMPSLLTAGTADCKPYVGIGTESPVTHLQVEGYTFSKKIKIGGDNYVFIHDFEVTGSSLLTGNFTSNLTANQSFTINQTETNGYQFLMSLNANNNNTKAIAVSNGSNTNSINTFNLYSDGRMEIGAASTAYNNNTLLRVYGGVNIGADYDYGSLMSTLLKVNGMIATRKIKVLAGNIPFPDYVFDKNYSLLSLSETNKFIKKNRHLPGIPSATEVQNEEGFDLGDLQLKSLEKIEEVFLHLIQLEQRIQLLEAENILLKKKLLKTIGTNN